MSISAIKAAFENQIVVLPLDIIVPQRDATKRFRYAEFYKQLEASLKHVGLIEPLVVYPRGPADYLLAGFRVHAHRERDFTHAYAARGAPGAVHN